MTHRQDPGTETVSLREFILMAEELSLLGCFEDPDPWLIGAEMPPWIPEDPGAGG